MHVEGAWNDLTTRGFVVVRRFLSEEDVSTIERAYRRAKRADVAIYDAREPAEGDTGRAREKIAAVLPEIRRATGGHVDAVLPETVFFATDRMNLGWHTDYKSYYLFQTHEDHLTFWLPIVKPSPGESGLSIVPMDRLRERAPEVFPLVLGRGAARYERGVLHYEQGPSDRRIACPVDLDELAESPDLAPGDALVMRGDLLHRTQDVTTSRISLSARAIGSRARLTAAALLTASPEKRRRMLGEPNAFCDVLAAFCLHGRTEMTAGELLAARERLHRKEPLARLAFAGARVLLPVLLHREALG